MRRSATGSRGIELYPAQDDALLDVLWTACRNVTRVSYNLEFWDAAPRRIEVEGRVVRLGGFRRQSPLLLSLVDTWGREHIDLLVIPPQTDVDVAEPRWH